MNRGGCLVILVGAVGSWVLVVGLLLSVASGWWFPWQ